MVGFSRIIEILDTAVGGPTAHVGAHGTFWRGLTRDEFVLKRVFGLPIVTVGDGAGSTLVKALKGEGPFGSDIGTPGASFRRMPGSRPPVSAAEIQEISDWIDSGCPEHEGIEPTPSEHVVYRIHPGVGVARLGSSPTEWFIGPEAPDVAELPAGPFRDASGLIKPQGALFHVFAFRYRDDGTLAGVREVTAAEAEIAWTVRLVNRKAAAPNFPPGSPGLRNKHIDDRDSLVIDTGEQTVGGITQAVEMSGRFLDHPVRLGKIATGESGRLVVLGGMGESEYFGPLPRRINNFANNDFWHDDVSDGPVKATLRFPGQEPQEADGAWVLVAPPKYAPEINSMTTMYDQALNAAATRNTVLVPSRVSFTAHVYPILKRVVGLQWVNAMARAGHGLGGPHDFLGAGRLAQLADPSPDSRGAREIIFNALIPPGTPDSGFDSPAAMPFLNDGLDPADPTRRIEATLTTLQYDVMRKWALGAFEGDWPGEPPTPPRLKDIPVEAQPAALDKAALDFCIGGPFYPGIESGYIMAQPATYRDLCRIDPEVIEPGGLTAGLAVPWQADFFACDEEWWPAQRPTSVMGEDGSFADWVPAGFGYLDMVDRWDQLGFIVRDGERFVEKERRLDLPVG